MNREKSTIGELRETVERLQLALEASGMGTWEMDLVNGVRVWSAATAEMHGLDPALVGAGHVELNDTLMHPEDRARLEALHAELRGGRDSYDFEYRTLKNGELRWLSAQGKVLEREAGVPLRIAGVVTDVTERHRAESFRRQSEERLFESEERLTTAEGAAGALVYDWNLADGSVWRSSGLTRILGWQPAEVAPSQQAWQALIHPEDARRLEGSGYERHLDSGGRYSVEYRARHKDGRYVWLLDSGRAFRDAAGRIARLAGAAVDISRRKDAERSLLRQASLIDLSFEPIFVWHPAQGIQEWNTGAAHCYGYSREEALGRTSHALLRAVHPLPFPALMERLKADGVWSGEVLHTTSDGRTIVVESRLQAFESDGEVLVLETNRDITERKAWEARQRLMMRELAHRVKNSFAVLQAILRSTLKSTPDPREFAASFTGRLDSMAAAQDILTDSDWTGAELGALARRLLGVYDPDPGGRILIDGPPVNLAIEDATPFALIFNELATNAIKHGALSAPSGTVELRWGVREGKLRVIWRESGGPLVVEPCRRGFGSRVIERSLAHAVVERSFNSTGLVCRIELPAA